MSTKKKHANKRLLKPLPDTHSFFRQGRNLVQRGCHFSSRRAGCPNVGTDRASRVQFHSSAKEPWVQPKDPPTAHGPQPKKRGRSFRGRCRPSDARGVGWACMEVFEVRARLSKRGLPILEIRSRLPRRSRHRLKYQAVRAAVALATGAVFPRPSQEAMPLFCTTPGRLDADSPSVSFFFPVRLKRASKQAYQTALETLQSGVCQS